MSVMKKYKWYNRSKCPHSFVVGIYGDSINYHAGDRLICAQCGKTLDGPVRIAELRKNETLELLRELRESEGG